MGFIPTPGTTKCPHCGGESGFRTTTTFKGDTLYQWDGTNSVEDLTVTREISPRCQDCGKPVGSSVTTT
jgi:transposase-like protein